MNPRILGLMTIRRGSQKVKGLGKWKAGPLQRGRDPRLRMLLRGRGWRGQNAFGREHLKHVLQNRAVVLWHDHVVGFALQREEIRVIVLQFEREQLPKTEIVVLNGFS